MQPDIKCIFFILLFFSGIVNWASAQCFLLVDLRDFSSDLGGWGGGQKKVRKKKALKMTSCFFLSFFLIFPEQTVKLVRYTNSLY